MGYFDAFGEALFKEDEEGNTVFYKWGVMGRGVIIDTPERKGKIVAFISKYYMALFLLIGLMQFSIFVYHMPILEMTLLFMAVGMVMTYWYLVQTTDLTRGLPYSKIRLTMENGWQKTAHRLPKPMIYGGFVSMLLLVAGSVAVMGWLDTSIIWAALLLLVTGLFGSYAYYKMIIFSREAPPVEPVKSRYPVRKREEAESIEWTPQNIAIVGALFAVVAGFVYYTYADSKQDFDERMARYNAMTAEEMAAYLADVNAAPAQIDPITRHAGADVNGTTIYLYRELTTNLLSDMIVDTDHLETEKSKMTSQLQREMCGSPTYDLFYDKGGDLRFIYHQVEENDRKYMFEVPIDKASCS